MANKKLLEFSSVILIFIIVNVLTFIFQKPITLNDGKGWDAGIYHYMVWQNNLPGENRSGETGHLFIE